MTHSNLTATPIAHIRTPFREKFGIPRQPALAPNIQGIVRFSQAFNDPDYLRGIEQFSHLWLIFSFHQHTAHAPSPLVRPPRLGGNEKIGVFASRSSFRPNGMGMSLVSYQAHDFHNGQLTLTVGGVDLLDGTPILDIKPYINYSDSQPDANCGYAQPTPQARLQLRYTALAQQQLHSFSTECPTLAADIETVLTLDPRPAYKQAKADPKTYSIWLHSVDVKWHVEQDIVYVTELIARR